MKKLSIGLLAVVCTACGHSVKIDRTELQQIFQQIADSSLDKKFIIDSIENFDTKTIKKGDTSYTIATYDGMKEGIWTNDVFAKIVTAKYLVGVSKADTLKGMPAHYSFSLPYFSADKNSFIIFYNYYCGNLCEEYSLRLYKKVNNKWVFVRNYFEIVS